MSSIAVTGDQITWRSRLSTRRASAWQPPGTVRIFQLALAAVWLLDAVLQFQSMMFTRGFGQMLAGVAPGNPATIADPILWDARLLEHHPALNAIFATFQLLLALGIAWRPTVKVALGASVAWAVGVWWFGEGLGEVLNSGASPLNGAPGAVIIYALLAVLLWPAGQAGATASFAAGRAVGERMARGLWLVLWGSLVYFSLMPANRAPQGMHDLIAAMAAGEPNWLAGLERSTAALVAHHGLIASIGLAIVLAIVAVGVYLPVPLARATLVLAVLVSVFIWVIGEAFGGILAGGATDPQSGLLLILLALAYWPATAASAPPDRTVIAGGPASPGMEGAPA